MVKNLKLLRNERGLSQQELADQLGINQQSINGYENRSTQPDIEMLMRLADFFHTTVDYLIGYESIRDKRLKSVRTEEIRLLENMRLLPDVMQEHIKGIIVSSVHMLKEPPNYIDK